MVIAFDARTVLEYLAVFKRRKLAFFVPVSILLMVTMVATLQWPPTFRSSAIVLVEEPDIPPDLVPTTVGTYAAERIQVIAQRVQRTSNLVRIIEKYGLYAEERSRKPLSSVVDKMREDIHLTMINAEVVDPRSGRSVAATIAFNFAFEHRRPETAKKVLEELVSLYLAGNEKSRREKAVETTAFLVREANRYGDLVKKLEQDLANFKERNAGSLPEEMPFNLQVIERTDRELSQTRREIQAAEQRKSYLEAQLSQINPYTHQELEGTELQDPVSRLKALQLKLISLSGIYGSDHPDVRRLEREIGALEQELENGYVMNATTLERRRQLLESQINVALERYSPSHPDVVKMQRELQRLESILLQASNANKARESSPNNPNYIQFSAEAKAIDTQLRSLRAQNAALRDKLQDYEWRVSQAPQVERRYLDLKREYDNAVATYNEINEKLMAAQIGQSLEEDRKNERLSLIEPPSLPIRPVKPNRLAIVVVGLIFSLGMGLGSVIVFELIDQRIYGARQVAAVTGSPPLVVVGHIRNQVEVSSIWGQRILIPSCALLTAAGGMFLINQFVIPLSPLWSKAVERLASL